MNRIVVVTGASGGLGCALVREFAAHEWQVVATGRSARPQGIAETTYHQFDASDPTAADTFWQELKSKYPNIEPCLVNNAGGYIGGTLLDTTPADFDQQMKSNYFSAVYMTRGLAAVYDKARIINVISSSALGALAKDIAYGASKAAEKHFFQSLQQEFGPDMYHITNLYPNNISAEQAPGAMTTTDLAQFIRTQAEQTTSLYLRDATIYPR